MYNFISKVKHKQALKMTNKVILIMINREIRKKRKLLYNNLM